MEDFKITAESFELAADGMVRAPEMARVLNMNPKSFRRRLRSMTDDRAGKGGEWRVSPEMADEIARQRSEERRGGKEGRTEWELGERKYEEEQIRRVIIA